MDDLTQQLQKVLSDPQTMGQLQGLLSSLGGQEEKPAPAPSGGPDLSALLGALGGGQASPPPAESPSTALAGLNPQALSLMARLGPLLNQANREDDATRLLRALRPLLGEARQKKVDEAIQILQMLRLLPLLKESGVFSGLLSGAVPNEVDMNKLREEAARRAREMQARAHIPPPRKPPKEPPRQEPPPPEPSPPPAPAPAPKGEPGLLDAFFQDKERTIILALLLLLSGDEKNHELLFALLFLLL